MIISMMPDVLIWVGVIVVAFCILVSLLERVNGGGRTERQARINYLLETTPEERNRDHPTS